MMGIMYFWWSSILSWLIVLIIFSFCGRVRLVGGNVWVVFVELFMFCLYCFVV